MTNIKIKFDLSDKLTRSIIHNKIYNTFNIPDVMIVTIEVLICGDTVDIRDFREEEQAIEFVNNYAVQMNEFKKSILKKSTEFIDDEYFKFNINFNEDTPISDKQIEELSKSPFKTVEIIIKDDVPHMTSVMTTLDDAIKTVKALKYVYDKSREVFERVWNSPEKYKYKVCEETESFIGKKCACISSPINLGRNLKNKEIIDYVIDSRDYNEYIFEIDDMSRKLYFLYSSSNIYERFEPYFISFSNRKNAIDWLMIGRNEYYDFKREVINYLLDEGINTSICMCISNFI